MSINFFSSESGENMDVTVIFKAYYKNQILKVNLEIIYYCLHFIEETEIFVI